MLSMNTLRGYFLRYFTLSFYKDISRLNPLLNPTCYLTVDTRAIDFHHKIKQYC